MSLSSSSKAPARSLTRIAGVACLSFCVILIAAQCGGRPITSLQANGISLRRIDVRETAQRVNGVALLPGDWVFEGNAMHVVVGGGQRPPSMRGAVLELTRRGGNEDESIEFLAPRVLYLNRSFPVDVKDMRVIERDGRPVLRVDGVASTPTVRFDVSRELTLGRVAGSLSMTTRVEAQEESPVEVSMGQRIAWGGDAPWVPGVGVLDDESWHNASFVGTETQDVGTVFGVLDAPVRLVARYEQHGATHFIEHTDVYSRTRTTRLRAPAYERSTLTLGEGDLGEATRRFGWVRGTPFPEVLVSLPYSPPGAEIDVLTADSHLPIVTARPDGRGQENVPLPPLVAETREAFVIVAKAFGHATSDEVHVSAARPTSVVAEIPRGGRVRISVRDAETGARIHSRARIIAANREMPVALGPDYAADGAGDSVVMPTGDALVSLPPGRYRVLVTHGPEWTLHDEAIEVTETFRPDVQALLSRVVNTGEWVACDFHVHASPSPDSHVTLEDRIASLIAEGVQFAVPTDHNHVTDYGPAILATHAEGFGTVSGAEITTADPILGHFNAFPLPINTTMPGNGAPNYLGVTPDSLFTAVHQIDPDTVVQVNHPRLEGGIGYFDRAEFDPTTGIARNPYSDHFDLMEVWNGFDLARKPAFDRVFGEWLAMLTRGRHITATGNSDSHLVRYQWAGYPRTYVFAPRGAGESRELVRSLRAGHAFVTSGPFLQATIDEKGPGDTAALHDHMAHVHVIVQAPPWMDISSVELWSGSAMVGNWAVPPLHAPATRRGAAARPLRVDPIRVNREIEIEFHEDSYLVVLVRGERPMDDYFGRNSIPPVAFTNPIWIDADGDGSAPMDNGDQGNSLVDGGLPLGGDASVPAAGDGG